MQHETRGDPAAFQRGVCYAHAWRAGGRDGYASATSATTLARLAELGVDWISLTPFGYLPRGSTAIHATPPPAGETDLRLAEETRRAHARGMKVALKPHLWLDEGAWPGAMTWPDDAAFRRFFDSYRALLRGYATLAARERMDLLVLGTELKSATARDPAAFRALIAELRTIYPGPLTYAANWDEAAQIPFWRDLDYIGIQAYQPLAARPGAAAAELARAWQPIVAGWAALAARVGRPILLTELGYRASAAAASDPSLWPEREANALADPAHQAACYRAAFRALSGQPWLAGIYIWKWFTDSRDEQGPTDFSPAGKPAEAVLGEFYRRRTAATRRPPTSASAHDPP